MQPEEALAFLKQGAAQIISEDELREKLALGRPLRIKLGVDPTTSDIHLGHTVVLRKLRQFQDLGHQAVLIIGDFTGMIGDPSGRSVTRPQLTHQEVIANAATYREQAFKILDPARTETVCNGDWFWAMSFEDVIRLNSRVTLQLMLQREDFKGRIDNQQPIHAHEIQYPIYELLLGCAPPVGKHPLEAKKQLTFEIVQTYHSSAIAQKTLDDWTTRFSKHDLEHAELPTFSASGLNQCDLVTLVCSGYREAFDLKKSRSEASRLIKQGSVELDGQTVRDPKAIVQVKSGQILRLDKRHAVRIT